ncbi:unnamed protein product [Prorocentrum cordatum]|uniref:RING-type domain-containing protein n=1 Tax=Prorocentrum cordatum TaxID=2364126 RepID=A0ABN9VBC9_9DINO|nr:unnamed protein product [Polarella glacialis]
MLRIDLRPWRDFSTRVLLSAGVVFLVAGPACAGLAKYALQFLCGALLLLYGTLMFAADFEGRMPSRLGHYLCVYFLVLLTVFVYMAGAVGSPEDAEPGATPRAAPREPFAPDEACSDGGWELAPASCAVPLDLAAGTTLWWAASPLLTSPLGVCALAARGWPRRLLQRCRRRVDWALAAVLSALLLCLQGPCSRRAPAALRGAELALCAALLVALLRWAAPGACDAWRGPVEHLPLVGAPGPAMQQCAVCLQALRREQGVCRTRCHHLRFHADCLEAWAEAQRGRAPECPLCREPLRPPSPRHRCCPLGR